MRISRFNPYYNLTFWQTVNLFKKIHNRNSNSRLFLIGTIQSQSYFENLKNEIKKENLPIEFVTGKEFTTNAKRLVEVADIVVATGRGVMEACAFNKKVYCPVKNADLPLELNKKFLNFYFLLIFQKELI